MFEPITLPGMITQADQTDLRSLVDCSYSIHNGATLEEVHRAFQKHGHKFMAVLDGEKMIGICSRSGIGMILGSRFGFSIFSKKPIVDHLLPAPVIIRIGTPLRNVLDTVFSRASDEFYDDIALVEGENKFIGLIQVHSLVKLQHRMLMEKLKQVEMHERNLRAANHQLEQLASEINAANADLARARDMALEGTRMKSEFLATMSHEIRTPMNGVIGMINLLMETPLNPEQMMYAKTVRSSGESLLDIINDILDFSKIEAGKMELSNHEFDIRELLEASLHLLVERAAAKGIELIWDVDVSVPRTCISDSTRIRQIIVNLTGNAVKFTEKGEVVVSARFDPIKKQFHFDVRDTGPGISDMAMSKLFAPFTQANSSTTRKHGGTGLGLSISKRLTELLGGRIGCNSEVGAGSIFWFEIPLAEATQPPALVTTPLENLRVLVMDDNQTLREVFSKHLESIRMRCTSVADTVDATSALASAHSAGDPYKFALIDLAGNNDDAIELCNALYADERYKDLKLIGMAMVGQSLDKELIERKIVKRHLYKPIRMPELFACMNDLLRADAPSTDIEPVVTIPTASVTAPKSLRVLIVEDTITNQVVARLMLEKMGHKCVVANNGLEALEIIRRNPFDCILMDCMMPEMDGFETTRRIRDGFCGESKQDIHIIAMTANAMRGDREKCIESGMDEYISKPVRKAELAARLEEAQKLLYVH